MRKKIKLQQPNSFMKTMKAIALFMLCTIALVSGSYGQPNTYPGVLVVPTPPTGATPPTLDPTALLEARSTTQGFLPPRMTTNQRNLIPAVSIGLQIYNTSSSALEIWNGTGWLSISSTGVTVSAGSNTNLYGILPGTWQEKTGVWGALTPIGGSNNGFSFTIGTKAYFGTIDGTHSFYSFDGTTISKVADFPGTVRAYGVAFSIGNFGYAGLGGLTGGQFFNDFWLFDPNGTGQPGGPGLWTNMAGTPASFNYPARFGSVAFTIGNEAYVGTGSKGVFTNEFYKFNPLVVVAGSNWTQIADHPGNPKYAAFALTINNRGFVGGGYDGGGSAIFDFYEYVPGGSPEWQPRANVPYPSSWASSFSIGTNGYVVNGAKCYRYETTTTPTTMADRWVIQSDNPVPRYEGAAFSIGGKGYFGFGVNNSSSYLTDLWQFTPTN